MEFLRVRKLRQIKQNSHRKENTYSCAVAFIDSPEERKTLQIWEHYGSPVGSIRYFIDSSPNGPIPWKSENIWFAHFPPSGFLRASWPIGGQLRSDIPLDACYIIIWWKRLCSEIPLVIIIWWKHSCSDIPLVKIIWRRHLRSDIPLITCGESILDSFAKLAVFSFKLHIMDWILALNSRFYSLSYTLWTGFLHRISG